MRFLPRPHDPRAQFALEEAGVAPLLARLYAARGVRAHAELDTALAGLLPPSLLTNTGAAAQLLADAIAQRQQLCVIADYDCDGATACAVAVRGLRMLGAQVSYVVPNRFEYGYGLTPPIVDLALLQAIKPHMLVTVDNGIASVEGVAHARAQGLAVLVTDHHLAGPVLPDANVIVNPNQPGCDFQSKCLAGVGVMFYVLLALRAELRARNVYTSQNQPRLDTLLDLVALGTVADVVPLDTNNRRLVAQGLARMRSGRMQPGVRALFAAAGRHPGEASTFDMGFALGPRINAAGRLADMSLGIECLITDDEARANELAKKLDGINRERRTIEADMREEAMLALETINKRGQIDAAAIALFEPHWHEGVVGIVAGRIKEKLNRPTFVFAPGQDGNLKGSGRSISGFHLRDALDLVAKRSPGVLLKFGGHAMAAGATIAPDAFEAFTAAFTQVAQEWLTPAQLARVVEVDGPMPLAAWRVDAVQNLLAQVWGQGFAAPLFSDEVEVLHQRLIGTTHSGFKLKIMGDVNSEARDAVRWGNIDSLPQRCRVAYRMGIDSYQGNNRLRMTIEAVEG